MTVVDIDYHLIMWDDIKKDPLPSISTRSGVLCVYKGRLKPFNGYYLAPLPNAVSLGSNHLRAGAATEATNAAIKALLSVVPDR